MYGIGENSGSVRGFADTSIGSKLNYQNLGPAQLLQALREHYSSGKTNLRSIIERTQVTDSQLKDVASALMDPDSGVLSVHNGTPFFQNLLAYLAEKVDPGLIQSLSERIREAQEQAPSRATSKAHEGVMFQNLNIQYTQETSTSI